MQTKNIFALVCIGFAKICGLLGVCLGFTNLRNFAGILLIVAAFSLVVSVVLCLYSLHKSEKRQSDIETLQRIISEGTLEQYLKDICPTSTKNTQHV